MLIGTMNALFLKMEEQIEVQNVHVCKIKIQGHTNVKMLPTPLVMTIDKAQETKLQRYKSYRFVVFC